MTDSDYVRMLEELATAYREDGELPKVSFDAGKPCHPKNFGFGLDRGRYEIHRRSFKKRPLNFNEILALKDKRFYRVGESDMLRRVVSANMDLEQITISGTHAPISAEDFCKRYTHEDGSPLETEV